MDIGCCMVAYGIRGHIWWAPAAVCLFLSTQAAAKGSTHQISGRAGKSTRVEKLDHPNRITTFRVDDDDDDGHSNWPEEQQVAPGGVSSSPFPRGRGGCWWQQMDAVTCQLKFTLQILLPLWWYYHESAKGRRPHHQDPLPIHLSTVLFPLHGCCELSNKCNRYEFKLQRLCGMEKTVAWLVP